MAPKKPVPTPPQKPVPPVTTPESVSADYLPPQKPTAPVITPESVSADYLPRIINVVHIKSGKPMEVSKDYYLRHQEKFVRE